MSAVLCPKCIQRSRAPRGLKESTCKEHSTALDGGWCSTCKDWRCQWCGEPAGDKEFKPKKAG